MTSPPLPLTFPSPIICSNETTIMIPLAQIRQSDGCGSVSNNEIFNLHLGSGAGPCVSIPCFLQDTSHIYWFHPPKQLAMKKQKILKKDQTPIIFLWIKEFWFQKFLTKIISTNSCVHQLITHWHGYITDLELLIIYMLLKVCCRQTMDKK